ncbi:MAG: ATP-binding protein [Phycisphaerales bacterium]
MWRGISLANKCLLLFGGAVVLIVLTALSVPWFRMTALVDEGQHEVSRQLTDVWLRLEATAGPGSISERAGVTAERIGREAAKTRGATDTFLARALRAMERDPARSEYVDARWHGLEREYKYARAIRGVGGADGKPGAIESVVVLLRRPFEPAWLLATNTAYLLSAGLFVLGLAVLVFYLITHQVILSPVRELKETAERVREGDLTIRSQIQTGDEFEELSGTFNAMLGELARAQDQLRSINSALDVKLNELAESNTALYEAARLKGEFLANISHELRTPLNSIIGFAELMRDQAQGELDAGDDSSRLGKRLRYLENMLTAGRGLLEMINSLLEMARIEAGKSPLDAAPINIVEACQGILGLIAPQAEKKGLELKFEAEGAIPVVETDAKKLQQIVFNFLSNAVKFTPKAEAGRGGGGGGGRVTLRVESLPARGGERASDRVRISVIDTGPGIAAEDQPRLFSKFTQLDAGHTREHAGTGLGLAISKELAAILQGEVQLVSDVGRGSMFSLIIPVTIDHERAHEQRLESVFRGTLAAQKVWA